MVREPFDLVAPSPEWPPLVPERTALLIIDLQYLDAHPDYGLGAQARARGRSEELAYRFRRIEEILPNVRALADACRRSGIRVIYVRIATALADGSDGSPSLRGLHCLEGSKEAEILEPIAPQPGDIVLTKASLSAFTTSELDRVLRRLGIQTLLAAGVITNGCVELTMRDAADRGYFGVLVEDCCGANSEALHRDALARMDRGFLRVSSMAGVLGDLGAQAPALATASARRQREGQSVGT